jgi:hypothetical protein
VSLELLNIRLSFNKKKSIIKSTPISTNNYKKKGKEVFRQFDVGPLGDVAD